MLEDDDDEEMSMPGPSSDHDEIYTTPKPSRDPSKSRINMYTPRLIAALDYCKVTTRKAMHLISATIHALKLNADDYILSRSSIEEYRSQYRQQIAEEYLHAIEVIMKLFVGFQVKLKSKSSFFSIQMIKA